jgi:NTP pyrophosphatase (non-canonical NTP hydrolase)
MNEDFAKMVNALAKPGDKILAEMTPRQANLLHMVVGISGEAGELLDVIKKHCIYQKRLDIVNVQEELGDILFYMQGLINELEMDWDKIIKHNQFKLSQRYNSGSYSNDQAKKRADK